MKLNKRAIKKVANQILREPERYNQYRWIQLPGTLAAPLGISKSFVRTSTAIKYCGTACCIAGWAALQNGKRIEDRDSGQVDGVDVFTLATEVFGISEDAAVVLFSGEPHYEWPAPFCTRWYKTLPDDHKGRAKIAYALLMKLIKDGEGFLIQ